MGSTILWFCRCGAGVGRPDGAGGGARVGGRGGEGRGPLARLADRHLDAHPPRPARTRDDACC
jgi:hypothetical protein